MTSQFEKELSELLNRNGFDNATHTPDFVLARYLVGCLQAYEIAMAEKGVFGPKWADRTGKEKAEGK